MSATGPSGDMSRLRERRRQARRRRRLARVDLGLGLLGAIVLLLATPGLAIAAVVALLVLSLCVLSVVLERRAARRSSREDRPGAPGSRRAARRSSREDRPDSASSRRAGLQRKDRLDRRYGRSSR